MFVTSRVPFVGCSALNENNYVLATKKGTSSALSGILIC